MDNPTDMPQAGVQPVPAGQLDPQTLMPAQPQVPTPSESSTQARTGLEHLMPSIIPIEESVPPTPPVGVVLAMPDVVPPVEAPVAPEMPDLSAVIGQVAPTEPQSLTPSVPTAPDLTSTVSSMEVPPPMNLNIPVSPGTPSIVAPLSAPVPTAVPVVPGASQMPGRMAVPKENPDIHA